MGFSFGKRNPFLFLGKKINILSPVEFFFTWISIFLFLINIFLNYQSMITHLQETWKIQNKVPLYITTFFK